MVWVVGFEPTASPFRGEDSGQTELHPVNKLWSGWGISKSRPPASKAGALPLSYTQLFPAAFRGRTADLHSLHRDTDGGSFKLLTPPFAAALLVIYLETRTQTSGLIARRATVTLDNRFTQRACPRSLLVSPFATNYTDHCPPSHTMSCKNWLQRRDLNPQFPFGAALTVRCVYHFATLE